MRKKMSLLRGGMFAVVAALFFLPAMLNAGSLEPSGPPAPTMRTLEEITPTWSKKLTCDVGNCPRFQVLADFNNEAVLDKETGLVWEKSPSTQTYDWYHAIQNNCNDKVVNNRRGWRLPTREELQSLVVYDPLSTIQLPAGHPFTNVQSDGYWSATTCVVNSAECAYNVWFDNGHIGGGSKTLALIYSWCVRGGQGYDGQ